MAAPLYLGLDVGTQGAKALVYDPSQRRVLSRGAASYDILPTKVPGRAEQHPSQWLEGSVAAVQQALARVDRAAVRAMGVSGQQHGLVTLAADGRVLRPAKLWCDVEAADEAAELSATFGCATPPGFTAPKLLWLKRREPEAWAALAHVLLPHDYMNWWLTGRFCMEAGDASGTGLFDTAQRRFDDARVAAVDARLGACLPALVDPNEAIGTVQPAVAAQLGLRNDVLVAPGGGDNMMSALGSGAVREGVLVMSLGTSGTLFGASGRPVLDPSGAVAPFCDCTGQWLPLLCTQNCTLVADEVRRALGSTHAELAAAGGGEPPGCEGVNMLPYLSGERTPNWPSASGALCGLRPGHLSRPGLLYRAALEGATFSLLAGYGRMRELGLDAPQQLYVVGGGSKNALWRRVICDAFELPLAFPLEAESAALGAALQAGAVATGTPVGEYVLQQQPALSEDRVEPDAAAAAQLRSAFERHVRLGEAMFA